MNTEQDLTHFEKLKFDKQVKKPINLINKKREGQPSLGPVSQSKNVVNELSHKSLPKVIFELVPKSSCGLSPHRGAGTGVLAPGQKNFATKNSRQQLSAEKMKDNLFGFQKQKQIHKEQSRKWSTRPDLRGERSEPVSALLKNQPPNKVGHKQLGRPSKQQPKQYLDAKVSKDNVDESISSESPRTKQNEDLTITPASTTKHQQIITQNQFSDKHNTKTLYALPKKSLQLNLGKEVHGAYQDQAKVGQGLGQAMDFESADLSGESGLSSISPMNGSPSPVALNVNTKKSNIIQKDKNLSISLEKLVKNNERRQMNQTMNKIQINQLLFKNNLRLRDQSPKNVPKTHRERIRDGELSSQTSSSDGAKQRYASQLSGSQLSNCTEERNFTPGQQQFKTFLKQQTADRSKSKLKMKSKLRKNKQLVLQLQNTSVRSHTRQVESKQEKLTDAINAQSKHQQSRKRGHLKQNSYIGSNRMSPTPQPIPIEIFSQTYSAADSSQQPNSRTQGLKSSEHTKLVLLSGGKDSANLSNYNISPERGQNLSGVFEQFNKKFQKTQEIQFNSQERTSELDSMVLSPFGMNSKAEIQEFSTNQKNFQKVGDVKNGPATISQSAHFVYFDNQNVQALRDGQQLGNTLSRSREIIDDEHTETKTRMLESEDRRILSKGVSSHKNKQSVIQTQSLISIQQQLIQQNLQMGAKQSGLDDLVFDSEGAKQNHVPSKLVYLSQFHASRSGTAGHQGSAPTSVGHSGGPTTFAQEDIDNTDIESINNTNSNTDIIRNLEALNGNISEVQYENQHQRMKILQQQITKGKQMQQQRVIEMKRPKHGQKFHQKLLSEDEGNADEVDEVRRQTEAQQPLMALRAKEAANFEEKESILVQDENEDLDDGGIRLGFGHEFRGETGSDVAEPANWAIKNGKRKQKEKLLRSKDQQLIHPQLFQGGSKSCNKIKENEEVFKGKRLSNQQNSNVINSTSQIQTTKYFNQEGKGDQFQPSSRAGNSNFQIKTPEISTILKNNTRKSVGSSTLESFRGMKPLGLAQAQSQPMHKTPSAGSTNLSNVPNQSTNKPATSTQNKLKRRETRIKSLYATTTNEQDLTLDLSKINQELNKISNKQKLDQLNSNSARKDFGNQAYFKMQRSSVAGSSFEKPKTQNKLSELLKKDLSKKSLKGANAITSESFKKLEGTGAECRGKMTLNSMQALRVAGGRSLERSQDKRTINLVMMEKMEYKHSISSDQKQKQGRSITTQIFDKITDMASYALAANLNPQQSPSNLRHRSAMEQNNNSNKIQDIKKSSSKLTMAAQLQKYRADGIGAPAAGKSVFSAGPHCYSPKFHKPQRMQIPPPNQGGPPVLNTSLINKQSNYLASPSSGSGSFIQHPRTTKANQSNGAAGDHANIIVTISPPDSQRSTQRNHRVGSGIQHIQTMKHANQGSKATSMGPGPYHFHMPKSARGLNSGEHKSKHEPQHFSFKNVMGIDNENLRYSENELDDDSVISSEDDKQENVKSSQQDLLLKGKQGQKTKNKINLSCFVHQFPSKSNHQRVSFMERISEQLEETPVDGQTSHKSPHSGLRAQNEHSKQSSIASHDVEQVGQTLIQSQNASTKRRKRTNHHQSIQQEFINVLDFNSKETHTDEKRSNAKHIGEHLERGFRNNGKHTKRYDDGNNLEVELQETLPVATSGLKPVSKKTAAALRRMSPQAYTSMAPGINNKHNSVLGIQPLGNVEAVEPMEEAVTINLPPSEQEQEKKVLENLPYNGCTCNRDQDIKTEGPHQKKGCVNTSKWLQMAYKEENYLYLSSYKLYQGFLTLSRNENNNEQENQIEQDIQQDLDRTFQHLEYFQRPAVKQSLKRILIAFSNYETTVGYVQGMNFIAAVLIVHTGEVAAFWLLCALMEKYQLKKVLSHGLTGLQHHEEQIEALGRQQLPKLFEHFDRTFVSVSLFSTDWIISVFMNFIPIELTHIYLDLFFEKSWQVFYEVALALLKYYENELLRLRDAGQIVGQIKQARLGCEHLLMLSSQPSLQSSRYKAGYDPSRASAPQDLQKITELSDSDYNPRQSDISGIPFSVINLIPHGNDIALQPIAVEDFKDMSILEDSRSDIMTEKNNKPTRSQSMMPQHNFALNHKKVKQNTINETDSVLSLQMAQSYMQNPLFIQNMKMWKQIIEGLKK